MAYLQVHLHVDYFHGYQITCSLVKPLKFPKMLVLTFKDTMFSSSHLPFATVLMKKTSASSWHLLNSSIGNSESIYTTHIICPVSLERGYFDGKKHPVGVGDAATLAQSWPSSHETPYKWDLVICLFHSYVSSLRTTSHPWDLVLRNEEKSHPERKKQQ